MAGKITGYTSEMCQQAMIDELEELFRDMKFNGQEGEKSLQIFKQFVPTPTDDDDDGTSDSEDDDDDNDGIHDDRDCDELPGHDDDDSDDGV